MSNPNEPHWAHNEMWQYANNGIGKQWRKYDYSGFQIVYRKRKVIYSSFSARTRPKALVLSASVHRNSYKHEFIGRLTHWARGDLQAPQCRKPRPTDQHSRKPRHSALRRRSNIFPNRISTFHILVCLWREGTWCLGRSSRTYCGCIGFIRETAYLLIFTSQSLYTY